MRLHVLSDLHLERSDWTATSPKDVDVVVIAGDVHRGLHGLHWARATYGDLPIVYVPGNHEFHRHSLPGLWEEMRDWGKEQNIHVLEQECTEVQGVRFFGATLWTDLCLFEDQQAACDLAGQEMTDYDRIRYDPEGRTLRPEDTLELNRRTREWLQGEVEAGRTQGSVIVTHHAPSERCLMQKRMSDRLSVCYASHHEGLVESTGAKLWIYGHTHWSLDFEIGDVRVLSNQRGYPGEDNNGFDGELVVKI